MDVRVYGYFLWIVFILSPVSCFFTKLWLHI